MLTQRERKQMDRYLSDWKRTKDKGTTVQKIRHKLGSVIWPLANKAVTFGMGGMAGLILGSALLKGSVASALPAVATFTAIGSLGAYVASGYMTFVENVTLRKAALLGRHMMRDHVPTAQRQYAIEKYMQKEGALFLNRKYMRKNPDKVALLRDGQNVLPIPNLISFVEDNSNRAMSGGRKVTTQVRGQFWRKSIHDILQASARDNPVSVLKRPVKQSSLTPQPSTRHDLIPQAAPDNSTSYSHQNIPLYHKIGGR